MPEAYGFPRNLLPLLRCVRDEGELSISRESSGDEFGLVQATIRCLSCAQEYPVENGIVRMMADDLTWESQHEIALKDREYDAMPDKFVPPSSGWRSRFADLIEIPPHLEALHPMQGCRVLELGCGDGRFTLLMAQLGADVVAVDFSYAALRKVSANLLLGAAPTTYQVDQKRTGKLTQYVGLVQADASNFRVAPRGFDRALSATPLDSRDERMKMFRTVSESLTDGGRYVAGVEYDDLYRKVFGLPLVRRYAPDSVLIEHLDMATMRREITPYFSRLRMQPIRAHLPLVKSAIAKRLPGAAVSLSRVVCGLPILKHLGEILLVSAERPRRLPLEGARRPGLMGAKSLYRWYKRRKGEDAIWDPGVQV
jgi:SAM-dependent methyltransferase